MGIFGSKNSELTKEQCDKLNGLLPSSLRKGTWKTNDFKNQNMEEVHIHNRMKNYIKSKIDLYKKAEDSIVKLQVEIDLKASSKIKLFNTEIYEAKPIGLVDVGIVKKFGTASTGNRFENGLLGYALEQSLDDAWAKGNSQEVSVNEVKELLKLRAFKLFPNCNLIYKYDVDFREIGSSGNVFVYLRGTACAGRNDEVALEIEKGRQEFERRNKEIEKMKEDVELMKIQLDKIPKTPEEIENKLA
ncbi:hypothetical protein [Algibacter mikhailovii]|uniref:Uncharacterized protein n=1 Tax=Algibacter mikhailovii TaxID=425498 RepID=A0A918RAE8_9FLAO|nr:hypothetical protein [Algibacter mikhailovii]GGZ90082.1 hypothetical protein GCM10007028_30580 [Algibacter mikhailovii]